MNVRHSILHSTAGAAAAFVLYVASSKRIAGATAAVAIMLLSLNPGALRAQAEAPPFDAEWFSDLSYHMAGPSRGGRVTAVTGHAARPHMFYMGATGGGVWKTTDYGETWHNVSDGWFTTTGSIGSIDIANSNPEIVYVGTGSEGLRSNVIIGRGAYRTTDGGETWEFLGLENTGQIGSIVIHPTNPEVVWLAALGSPFGENPERGVYKTVDGGESWEHVLFLSDSIGAVDLELKPEDPSVIYAAMWRAERKPWTIISGSRGGDGIWKSTDGGESWVELRNGLPELMGKIDLAVSADDPERVYALVEAAPQQVEGLYRSDDAGRSWRLINDSQYLLHRPFYFTNLHADPTDADVLYAMALRFYKSTDGGESWDQMDTPHSDDHDLWINPENPEIMIESNDGGAAVTLDGGESWSSILNQPTAEMYQVDVSDEFPYWLCAGQQDNSTICVPGLPPSSHAPDHPAAWWRLVAGCETGPAIPKPGSPNIIFGNCKGRFSVFDRKTGQERQFWVGAQYMYGHPARELDLRFQRVSPIEVSPHNPDVVYHAAQYVYRTTNHGLTWERISPDLTATPPGTQGISGEPITRDITGEEFYSTIYAVEVSPHDPDIIWVGSNDGLFHVTRDGGESWTDITPPDMPPMGRVQNIEPSPHDPGTAYFAYYRYLLNDWHPYVYRTEDYGGSWTLLTNGENGIPADYPVRVVREDPVREGLLYAGTSFGMFISYDDGTSWHPFQLDLPVTPVTDIEIFRGDLVLSTMGRGFWILHDLAPVRQWSAEIAASDAHLFTPAESYRMRYRSWSSGPAEPEYPRAGAMIEYWLGESAEGEVMLEILNADGEVVRGFSSHADGYAPAGATAVPRMPGMDPLAERVAGRELGVERGVHRFIWGLRYPGTWDYDEDDGEWERDSGPLAVPGDYTVRLSVGDWNATRPLTVKTDPRVAEAGITIADMEAQLALNLRIRDAVTRAHIAAVRIDRAQARLEEESGDEVEAIRTALAELEGALVTDPNDEIDMYPEPMLIDQLEYLQGMTRRADQRPGEDAYERYSELRRMLDGYLSELNDLLRADVATED